MKTQHLIPLLPSLTLVLALPTTRRGPQISNSTPEIPVVKEARHGNDKSDGPPQTYGYKPIPPQRVCQLSISPQTNTESSCPSPIIFNANQSSTYLCGDWRLGPVVPPKEIPVEDLTDFYRPFGHLCPAEFLSKYWDDAVGYWAFPEHEGFSLDVKGQPITGNYTLQRGTLVDRFGGPGGRFVSPAATLYIERALPPSNLDTGDFRIPNNYHLYSVEVEFTVAAGPIAPWFEQPGQGVQYHLPEDKTVQDVVDQGYLVERAPLELLTP